MLTPLREEKGDGEEEMKSHNTTCMPHPIKENRQLLPEWHTY